MSIENYEFVYTIVDGHRECDVLVSFEVDQGYSFSELQVLEVLSDGVDLWPGLKNDPVLGDRIVTACAMFNENRRKIEDKNRNLLYSNQR